jgi:hypothetical protein
MNDQPEMAETIAYLSSDAAHAHFDSPYWYWPKWRGPWWRMLLLHEMGETARIPEFLVRALVAALAATPIDTFPAHPGDLPDRADPYNCYCHCELGNVYRVLDAYGVDVDETLPWMSDWFLAYQMADGGLNCDDSAYLVTDECASSMVGTIAAFEALVQRRRDWSGAEKRFVERAACFLIGRQLRLGSTSRHNAAERESAAHWKSLCFPRFYHYDVLRGLSALVAYAERARVRLPTAAIADVVAELERQSAAGGLTLRRRCGEGHGTITPRADGTWDHERRPAARFPLLDAVSAVGTVSPYLSAQWDALKPRLAEVTG